MPGRGEEMNKQELSDLKANMAEYVELALINKEARKHATERMSIFLKPRSDLADITLNIELELADLRSLKDASYAKAMANAQGSNAEKQKAEAKANPEYLDAEKQIAVNEAILNYIKAHQAILVDATFNYRRLTDSNNGAF
jgi:formylmethanofuran dehydrogenase subunit A